MESNKETKKSKGEKAMTQEQMEQLIVAVDDGRITGEFFDATINGRDQWVPGSGGNETWTLARNGRSYLYCYNPATQEHGWLNQSDIVEMESPYGL
jgi:hypothetical protein